MSERATRVNTRATASYRNPSRRKESMDTEIFDTVARVFEFIGVGAMAFGIVLAIIVFIRTVLSFSLQIEIEGVAPWKRALLTSPQLMAKAARAAKEDS